jgi:hypothetical protein
MVLGDSSDTTQRVRRLGLAIATKPGSSQLTASKKRRMVIPGLRHSLESMQSNHRLLLCPATQRLAESQSKPPTK